MNAWLAKAKLALIDSASRKRNECAGLYNRRLYKLINLLRDTCRTCRAADT